MFLGERSVCARSCDRSRVSRPSCRLGSDIGGGNAFSLVRVLEEAYKVGMCNNTMLDGSVNPREQDLAEAERNRLSPYRGYYLATLGGYRALLP